MKAVLFTCILTSITFFANAQKIALVLSGGGAKGIAHVGVLKVLEENHIPIDYIVGTSMGAIVGGFYAAGFTPGQIEDIILSAEFQNWVNGKTDEIYNYHYFGKQADPSLINLQLDMDESWSPSLKATLAPDAVINYILAEYLAEASQISGNNFDSLFVPFRAIAADIFTQSEIVLKNGILAEGVRASMAVPFFYPPVRVNNDRLLFDGGIYDNFPVDVARKEFNPDVVIGVNVSTAVFADYPYDEDQKLAGQSLLLYILNKSDPSRLSSMDIYIEPDLEGLNVLDFSKAPQLLDSGEAATIRKLAEIRRKISGRTMNDGLSARRQAFHRNAVPISIKSVQFRGFNEGQITYLRNMFRLHKRSRISKDEMRRAYFKLVSEDFFREVYPKIKFDKSDSTYTFELIGKSDRNFKIDAGGFITTRGFSELFLGLGFNSFSRNFSEHGVQMYTGRFYQSVRYFSRFYMSGLHMFYLEPFITYNNWDYLDITDILAGNKRANSFVEQNDLLAGIHAGLPVGSRYRLTFSGSYINNGDQYSNSNEITSSDKLDILKFDGLKSQISISRNSLNRKLYPSTGVGFSTSISYFTGEERYTPGSTSMIDFPQKKHHDWLQMKVNYEQYHRLTRKFHAGWEAESVISNHPYFSNYTGTMLNAPVFNPLNDSRIMIIPEFRSFSYLAGGLKAIYVPGKRFEARLEGYAFKPLYELRELESQSTGETAFDKTTYFAGTLNFVYHSPAGPVSLATNYYNPSDEWALMFHIGYLLFNKRSIE